MREPIQINRKRSDSQHKAESVAAGFPALLVAAERVASTVSQGVHGRRRVGQGETFWQFRRYEYGDSVQQIDWRQSAKSTPVYVRETEWEAAQSVWLWRDGSASMDFQSSEKSTSKRERASLLLLALASLLVRGGERMALLGTGMLPATGRAVLPQFWSMLEANAGAANSLPQVETLPRYARMVWFGDFLSRPEELDKVVRTYANLGIKGHLVQVLDSAEELLPYDGRILFGGVESGEGDVLVRRVEELRGAYQQELARHNDALKAIVRRYGWSLTTHRTDHAPEPVLLALFVLLSEAVGG
ncbi:MAG: DUF58 domain-containing protein [Rhodospirillales bacterium]|nr:DUF58 domain-containing protein [Rhodospirillales bacterium]